MSAVAQVWPTAGLNVRAAPDPNARVQFVAPGGTSLVLRQVVHQVNGVTWVQLVSGEWVQRQFLATTRPGRPLEQRVANLEEQLRGLTNTVDCLYDALIHRGRPPLR